MKPLLFLLLLTFSLSSWAQGDKQHTLIGKPAPRFEVLTLEGKNFKLEDYIGKPIIIDFWSTRCRPCLIELPAFEQLQEEYTDLVIVTKDGYHVLIKTSLEGTKMAPPPIV